MFALTSSAVSAAFPVSGAPRAPDTGAHVVPLSHGLFASLPIMGMPPAPLALPAPQVYHVPGPALRVRAGKKLSLQKKIELARRKNIAAVNKAARQGNNGATAVYHDARLASLKN